jgi:hypothetical protein
VQSRLAGERLDLGALSSHGAAEHPQAEPCPRWLHSF